MYNIELKRDEHETSLVVQWLGLCASNSEATGLIPGSGRFPGGENGSPLQYSCLENSMTEEPSGLQFMWLQRVERDWATNTTLSGTIFKPK